MKTISVVVPTYNEEENVSLLAEELIKEFTENLPGLIMIPRIIRVR